MVTVVFAHLVDRSPRAEALDPEDVHALLAPSQTHVRNELERYGATVEKFIGEAVMAVFGAPVAHEDDPERAVRAALAFATGPAEHEQPRAPHRRQHRRGAGARSATDPTSGNRSPPATS